MEMGMLNVIDVKQRVLFFARVAGARDADIVVGTGFCVPVQIVMARNAFLAAIGTGNQNWVSARAFFYYTP